MERIKKALQRAQEERETALYGRLRGPGQREDERRRKRDGPQLPEAEAVDRTRTRVVELDADHLREHRIIDAADNDRNAQAYKILRTHVLQRMRAKRWNLLGVTSPGEGNGKTLTAVNLSISMARELNQRVLLVDLDLRHPSVAKVLFADQLEGISEYLTEDRDLVDLVVNPGIDRLVILPGNKSFSHSSEMLSSPRMVRLADELKTCSPNQIVVFDLPPLLGSDDVIAFSPYIDCVLLVVEEGGTEKDELRRASELLGDVEIIGTVLNKSEDSSAAYGYYRV